MTAMRAQAIDTVAELFEDDPRVAVVLAEISVDRFRPVFVHDPARAVNVGIMEQTMVGVAAGYALEGFHPVIHTITPFVAERALEQLKLDFGHQQLGVLVITVGGSYDYGSEGPTHHSPGDVQALLTIPATEILVPGAPPRPTAWCGPPTPTAASPISAPSWSSTARRATWSSAGCWSNVAARAPP